MGPGPNGQGMTLYNMSTSAWELVGAVYTTQPAVVIAPRLPFPPGAPMIRQSTQAAPWVEAVDSCASMQVSVQACIFCFVSRLVWAAGGRQRLLVYK